MKFVFFQMALNKAILTAEGNFWQSLKSWLDNITTNLKTISYSVFALALIAAGIAWVMGGRGAEFAKSTLMRVILAIMVIALAAAFITTLADGASGITSF